MKLDHENVLKKNYNIENLNGDEERILWKMFNDVQNTSIVWE